MEKSGLVGRGLWSTGARHRLDEVRGDEDLVEQIWRQLVLLSLLYKKS
jgi:hypothetical protein